MTASDTTREHVKPAREEDLLTIKQVQELLKVGRTFAYSLTKSGELPTYRVGRLLRVRRRDVNRWLEQRKCIVS
jgi:putative molybdopterin biosynthesis protein